MHDERERIATRIADLRLALRESRSEDVRQTLRQAIADCEEKLRELDAGSGEPGRRGTGSVAFAGGREATS